jgi:hypothetical protein
MRLASTRRQREQAPLARRQAIEGELTKPGAMQGGRQQTLAREHLSHLMESPLRDFQPSLAVTKEQQTRRQARLGFALQQKCAGG